MEETKPRSNSTTATLIIMQYSSLVPRRINRFIVTGLLGTNINVRGFPGIHPPASVPSKVPFFSVSTSIIQTNNVCVCYIDVQSRKKDLILNCMLLQYTSSSCMFNGKKRMKCKQFIPKFSALELTSWCKRPVINQNHPMGKSPF